MKRVIKIVIISILSAFFTYPTFGQDIFKIEDTMIPEGIDKEFYDLILDNEDIILNYSTGNFVNVREFPNTDSIVLGQVMRGEHMNVIAIYNEWACIQYDVGIAFVLDQYLSEYEIEKSEYTEEELYVMAHVLAGECQGYPDLEQLYVGSVVLNRRNSSKYPDTIKGVVFQRGQYACTWDGNYYREPTEANWKNARWLLEYGSVLPDDVMYQSRRKLGKGIYLKTKYHYYCY